MSTSKVSAFYKSKAWERFREALINERTTEDGVICAHCGQPIIKKYDIIGHHKTELTDDNVDDATVSLNPDNVDLIHFRCHNVIHERFDGAGVRRVYIVYGAPCSGKSSFVNENARPDDLIVDMDRIWSAICPAGWETKPARIKAVAFAVRDTLIESVRTRAGQWRTAYIVGGYPVRTDRDRLAALLGAETVYIEASREDCLDRAAKERPAIWEDYIEDWFDDFTP